MFSKPTKEGFTNFYWLCVDGGIPPEELERRCLKDLYLNGGTWFQFSQRFAKYVDIETVYIDCDEDVDYYWVKFPYFSWRVEYKHRPIYNDFE